MSTLAPSESDWAFNLFLSHQAKRRVGRLETEPAGITSLAAHAVMRRDKFLAAELMSRLCMLPARELAFMLRQELESVIVGNNRAEAAITVARQRARGAGGTARDA